MKKRKQFTREFKLEAVRLLEEGTKPAADLARELGIRRNQLYKWKDVVEQKGDEAFPGKGRRPGSKSQGSQIA
jgi:transposase